jgi:hypothetical protein
MRPGRPTAFPTVHIQSAMEPTEAGHAAADQVRVARDVAAMFDKLRAMGDRHAELHADRARFQARVPAGCQTGTGAAVLVAAVDGQMTYTSLICQNRSLSLFSSNQFMSRFMP